jgi:hypothetical protein
MSESTRIPKIRLHTDPIAVQLLNLAAFATKAGKWTSVCNKIRLGKALELESRGVLQKSPAADVSNTAGSLLRRFSHDDNANVTTPLEPRQLVVSGSLDEIILSHRSLRPKGARRPTVVFLALHAPSNSRTKRSERPFVHTGESWAGPRPQNEFRIPHPADGCANRRNTSPTSRIQSPSERILIPPVLNVFPATEGRGFTPTDADPPAQAFAALIPAASSLWLQRKLG